MGQAAQPVRILGARGLSHAGRVAAAVPLADGAGGGGAAARAAGARSRPRSAATSTRCWPRSSGAGRSPAATSRRRASASPAGGSGRRARRALEWLFSAGLITTKTRRGFERVYDLTERVIPRAILDAPTPTRGGCRARAGADRRAGDGRRHRRRPAPTTSACCRPRRGRAVGRAGRGRRAGAGEGGGLGASRPTSPPAPSCRGSATGASLLSPFDNLIWRRERTERMFDVALPHRDLHAGRPARARLLRLPFLLGERIAARVDLKADRAAGVLLVQAAHLEPGADEAATAPALAAELRPAAAWLGLPGVAVRRKRGDLATGLEARAWLMPISRHRPACPGGP